MSVNEVDGNQQQATEGGGKQARYNRALRETLSSLAVVVKRQHQTRFEQKLLEAKEQALCDLVLHQRLFSVLLAPHQQQQHRSTPQQLRATQLQDALCAVQQWNHGCVLCEPICRPASPGTPPVGPSSQQQQQQGRQPSTKPCPGHGPIPSSYVSQLLLAATRQQRQQAASMSAQDWQGLFARLMPQLLMLLEVTSRNQYQLGQHSSSSSMHEPTGSFHLAETAVQQQPQPPHKDKPAPGCAQHKQQSLGSIRCSAQTAAAGGSMPSTLQDRGAAGHHQPLGICPVLDMTQLMQTVDSVMTPVLLALLHNHVPLLQASAYSFSAGPTCTSGMPHWRAVVQRMQLTETQEMQLSACMDEYGRLAGSSRQLGASLAPHVEAPSLLLAAEQAQHSSSRSLLSKGKASKQSQQQKAGRRASGQKRPRGGGGRGAAAGRAGAEQQAGNAAAAPEGCSNKELDHFLLKYVQLQHLHLLNLVSFVVNTLSQTQLAVAFVGAYPFAPDFLAIAAAAREALLQRQQQRLHALEQAVMRRETLSGEEVAREPAATAAAASSGAPAGAGRARKGRRGRKPAGADGSAGSLAGAQAAGCASQPQAQLLQCLTQQHVQRRAAELQEHQGMCWAELGAATPARQQQQQQPQQPVKQVQQKKQAVVETGQPAQQPGQQPAQQQLQEVLLSADADNQPGQQQQHLQLGTGRLGNTGLESHCRQPDTALHAAAAHAMDVDC